MTPRTVIWLGLSIVVVTQSMAAQQELPEGDGKKLLEERCAGCHSAQAVVRRKQSQSDWKALVLRMVGYGARLNDKEVNAATEYLARYFGSGSSAVAETPEEKRARKFIEGICTSCHDAGLILSTKATKQEWFDIITRMNGKDAGLSPRDVDLLVDYLARRYGPE
jgi:cytochrome c5